MSLRRFRAPLWGAFLLGPLVGCSARMEAAAPEMPYPSVDMADAPMAAEMAGPPVAADRAGQPSMASPDQGYHPSQPIPSSLGQPTPSQPAPSQPTPAPSQPGQPVKAPTAPEAHPRGAKEVATTKGTVEQLIIFTGNLDLQVDGEAFGKTLHDVVDLAVHHGGYIGEQSDHRVTVRVPSQSFREVLRKVEDLGEVLHRSVQAQDVSEEFHDVKVRLENLLATRKRIESFLDRTTSIDEVLRIEQELGRLNAEIDRLQGRMRFLSARAAYSTITINLRAKAKPIVVADTNDEPPPPPPPPPPRTLDLPIDWLREVSLDGLLRFDRQ
jgi:hypothetical protein